MALALRRRAYEKVGGAIGIDVDARRLAGTEAARFDTGGNSETQEKPSSGKILKRGRLNSQRDGATAVDVIDSRSQIQLPCARRDSGKKHEGIGAVGLALPERAKAGLFDQRR